MNIKVEWKKEEERRKEEEEKRMAHLALLMCAMVLKNSLIWTPVSCSHQHCNSQEGDTFRLWPQYCKDVFLIIQWFA